MRIRAVRTAGAALGGALAIWAVLTVASLLGAPWVPQVSLPGVGPVVPDRDRQGEPLAREGAGEERDHGDAPTTTTAPDPMSRPAVSAAPDPAEDEPEGREPAEAQSPTTSAPSGSEVPPAVTVPATTPATTTPAVAPATTAPAGPPSTVPPARPTTTPSTVPPARPDAPPGRAEAATHAPSAQPG